MSAWFQLVKKELRLGLVAFFISIIAYIVLIGLVGCIGFLFDVTWEAIGLIALMLTIFLPFYLVYYLFISLQSEQKRLHLWLHSPMPGYGLLSAKLTAGMVSFLVLFLLTYLIAYVAFKLAVPSYFLRELELEIVNISGFSVFLSAFIIIVSAITIGIGFIFFWMIYLVLKKYYRSFSSFCITLLIFIICGLLYFFLTDTEFYKALTMWGEISEVSELFLLIEDTDGSVDETEFVYIGDFIFEIVFDFVLFLASCWMLDRKVEV